MRGVVVASVLAYVIVYFVSPVHGMRLPRSVAVMDLLITLTLVAGVRLAARTLIERPSFGVVARGKEVIVVGAGDAGRLIVQEMQRSRMLAYTPIGFVDDDARKRNTRIHGVRVLGTMADLPRIVREFKPDEVLIAIPSASGETRRLVVEAARGLERPGEEAFSRGLYELITGDRSRRPGSGRCQVRGHYSGEEQVEVDFEQVASYLKGHTVLITGAGGSIGAELCRQIARVGPARLILVDNAETPLFEIGGTGAFVDERHFTAVVPLLSPTFTRSWTVESPCSSATGRREVVFHAAAYKHVPLMEAIRLRPLQTTRSRPLRADRRCPSSTSSASC